MWLSYVEVRDLENVEQTADILQFLLPALLLQLLTNEAQDILLADRVFWSFIAVEQEQVIEEGRECALVRDTDRQSLANRK